MFDITALLADLDGMELSTNEQVLRQKSRDFHWFSPVLSEILASKRGHLWVSPRNEDEVLRVLNSCRTHRVPVTIRGGATGNYGQCVPLHGGVILDMKDIDQLHSISPDGVAEVGGGATMLSIDNWARQQGWELKAYPATKKVATIAGYLSGGGGGVGTDLHGVIGARGNLLGVTIATLQDPPVLMDLAGKDTGAVIRSYGTTGVITRVRFSLKPAQAWRDVAVAFSTFDAGARFGVALCAQDGIPVAMCYAFDAALAKNFHRLERPKDQAIILAMAAPASLLAVRELAREHGGTIICEQETAQAERDPQMTPFYEYCNGHAMLNPRENEAPAAIYTTLAARFSTMQTLDELLATMKKIAEHFPGEMWRRGVISRGGIGGGVDVHWTNSERFKEMHDYIEAQGVKIPNIHSYRTEESSAGRRPGYDQVAFKHKIDPLGLLNPGKLASFVALPEIAPAAE